MLWILISVIAIGIVSITIYSLIITYIMYIKAKQFDRYTVITDNFPGFRHVHCGRDKRSNTYKPLCASNSSVPDLFRSTGLGCKENIKTGENPRRILPVFIFDTRNENIKEHYMLSRAYFY